MIIMLFQENVMVGGVNLRLYQKLGDFLKGRDYAERNVSDLRIQLTSAQVGYNRPKWNSKLLEVLSVKCAKILAKSQLSGQVTDFLEQNIMELSKVITMETQENSDNNNAQNRTMGVFGVRYQLGRAVGIWD